MDSSAKEKAFPTISGSYEDNVCVEQFVDIRWFFDFPTKADAPRARPIAKDISVIITYQCSSINLPA